MIFEETAMSISAQDLEGLFLFDPAAPRMMGFAITPSTVSDSTAQAVSICFELLDRAEKKPSGKWIWLQLQPAHAVALAASILALAKQEQWPLRPDFLELVERIRLSNKSQAH
jgi:hypothetical protein